MKKNRTIERTFEILSLLKKNGNGMTLKAICDTLNIPKTSGFDIIQTLLSLGIVEQPNSDVKKYDIGLNLFVLGNSYLLKKTIYSVGNKYLKILSEKMNKTTFIGILNGTKVVYIQKYEPEITIKTSCVVGSTADVYCTSLGKSLLAFSDKSVQDKIISEINFVKYRQNTIDNEEDLRKDLEKTYRRGYAIDNNEMEDGIVCVGAPIYGNSNKIIASISLSGLGSNERDLDAEGVEVRKTALLISRELGYTG